MNCQESRDCPSETTYLPPLPRYTMVTLCVRRPLKPRYMKYQVRLERAGPPPSTPRSLPERKSSSNSPCSAVSTSRKTVPYPTCTDVCPEEPCLSKYVDDHLCVLQRPIKDGCHSSLKTLFSSVCRCEQKRWDEGSTHLLVSVSLLKLSVMSACRLTVQPQHAPQNHYSPSIHQPEACPVSAKPQIFHGSS